MNKNTGIIVGIIVVIAIVGGVYASMSHNKDTMMDKKMDDSLMMKNDNDVMMKDVEMKDDTTMKKDGTVMSDKTMVKNEEMMKGTYEAYSPEKVSRAETGDVVLFFHASWCPSCISLNSDIEKNVNTIPKGVTILKVDYDKEVELKKKYGVTSQHTLVQVDKDGNLVKKWSGGSKLSGLVSEII